MLHLFICQLIADYLLLKSDVSEALNEPIHVTRSESDEGDSEVYAGLRPQDLQEAKDQLLVETADMLHIPLFTAEALLRDNGIYVPDFIFINFTLLTFFIMKSIAKANGKNKKKKKTKKRGEY